MNTQKYTKILGFLGFLALLGIPALIYGQWERALWFVWVVWFIFFFKK